MNTLTLVGVILIVLGLAALALGGFSYTKDRETADLGPIDISVEEKERVSVPPALSIASVVVGVILLVMGTRRRRA